MITQPKTDTVDGALTDEQFKDLIKVRRDVFFFSWFIFVIHPILGKTKFDLYPYQKTTLWYFLTKQFNIVLKFRQAGLTELISMYCLWLAMYHPNKNIIIISIKDRVAKKVLRKIKYMYKNLPKHLQVKIINGRSKDFGTASEIEFANGSLITSVPTTEDAARSEAVSLLVIDEGAIVKWANQIWAAAFPTLSTGGSAIVNSTPYGVGNWFHNLWVESCSGGVFNPIRLKWEMHPERDQAWYDKQRLAMGARRTAQEIDGDFLTSGYTVFDLVDIRAIEENLSIFETIRTDKNGTLRIYKEKKRGEQYFIGGDVATGRARDYSAFSIMNKFGEEYASFKGKLSPSDFADLMMKYGRLYNNAVLAPESNDIGLSTAERIQKSGYPNLYYSRKILKAKGDSKPQEEKIPGWYTTKKNRPVIIAALEEDIRNENIIIKCPYFTKEAYTFIYDQTNRPVAMGKDTKANPNEDDLDSDLVYSDDAILAKAITNQVRKGRVKGPLILPK